MKGYDLKRFQRIEAPNELHDFVLQYNWDDGIEIPCAVIRNRNCDKGTALLIYWLIGPGYFYQYESRNEIQRQYEVEHFDLLEEIERRYLSGFYQNNTILFNPRYDARNDGYDHTRTYDDFSKKREIPAEMFEPSLPDLEWETLGKPLKSAKKVDYKALFKSFDNDVSKFEMDEE